MGHEQNSAKTFDSFLGFKVMKKEVKDKVMEMRTSILGRPCVNQSLGKRRRILF